ncbi:UNVERIFIED_CONTAM: GPI inositol-deacylase [Sesamum calycinum]|uniref:GPI inositol-deacylase n=1 Tax=Sesamum calycinum TaxID=2727403 RepID=A0AAW2MN07_9LAMI
MILSTRFRGGADMKGHKTKCRAVIVVVISIWIGLAGLFGLLKPISNGCVMTYMYPTYIPIPMPGNASFAKYGLYLYHEGWRKIDYDAHLKRLNGIPVLFIPGNGGSYKQASFLL